MKQLTSSDVAMSMNNYLSLIVLVLMMSGFPILHSQTQSAVQPARTFKLQANYNPGVAQAYEITETTSVVRTHSDSSSKKYSREVTYFATFRCIESRDAISTVVVNLDSLRYKFSSQGVVVEYDSQKDVTPKNFADLNNYFGPLNRPYNLTYDPYGEVSKVEGEQIEFWRDYFVENKDGLDSVMYMIWMQSLDRENLLQYGDLQKHLIPGRSYAIDSTWNTRFALRVDGVIYSDTVKPKLNKYTGGYFIITANDTLAASPQQIHVYGIPAISNLTEGFAAVKNELSLTTSGTIDELVSEVNAWFRATVGMETFTHNTVSTLRWKLTGQYQW